MKCLKGSSKYRASSKNAPHSICLITDVLQIYGATAPIILERMTTSL